MRKLIILWQIMFIYLLVMFAFTFYAFAGEIAGYDVKSKEYAKMSEDMAQCFGFFTVMPKRSYELQFEVDEEEFSDDALAGTLKDIMEARRIMQTAEIGLPSEHRNYLQQKRTYSKAFGGGFASTITSGMLANELRDCHSLSLLILNGRSK